MNPENEAPEETETENPEEGTEAKGNIGSEETAETDETTEAEDTEAGDGEEISEEGENESAAEAGSEAETPGKKTFRERREEKKAAREAAKVSKEVEKKDAELAALNDKYLRICAEYDNFRKRTQKEKEALYSDIRSDVITSFLPVYDNLLRAIGTRTEDEAYAKGVEMIMNQFNTTMEKLGAEEIPALGETFDPNVHNAVMHVDDETKGESEIVEVFQKGFRIGEKVIRFAMVKVAN